MGLGVRACPSALLQAELQAWLKAITRECPSLPSKETLAAGCKRGWSLPAPEGALTGSR